MAHQWIRLNLASAIFPFETDLAGRTVIIAGADENYNYLDQLGEPIKDRGIPQAYYMHNCMPTAQGYQSIGQTSTIVGFPGATDFDTIIPLDYVAPQVSRFLLAPAAGKNYVYDSDVGVWAKVSSLAPGTVADNVLVTYAYVSGVTYFLYANYGCFKYDSTTKLMVSVTLTGLTIANVVAICGAQGYMIAIDNLGNMVWSSASNATDFTPSLVTGAGGGSLQQANGRLNFLAPMGNGFVVYCERNAVAVQYTGNINYPWAAKEIAGSGGVARIEDVTYQTNTSFHYAWTTAGLQELTQTGATFVFPEVTGFFAANTFEDFDETTLVFTQQFLTTPLYISTALIAARYAVFSYGKVLGVYTHALVFDILLSRWGKLKLTHRRCFEWTAPNLYGVITYGEFATAQPPVTYGDLWNTTYGQLNTVVAGSETPEKNLAFLQADGKIIVINFNLSEVTADGVLMLGKIQLQRNKFIVFQRCDVNNVEIGNAFDFYVVPTLDGQNLLTPVKISAAPNLVLAGPKLWRMQAEVTGQNLSLLAVGAFNLVSMQMDFTLGGDL